MAMKTATLAAPDSNEAKYQTRIEVIRTEIDRILLGMKKSQVRIDRLRERTRARLAELKSFTA